jgi:hypothetical protein
MEHYNNDVATCWLHAYLVCTAGSCLVGYPNAPCSPASSIFASPVLAFSSTACLTVPQPFTQLWPFTQEFHPFCQQFDSSSHPPSIPGWPLSIQLFLYLESRWPLFLKPFLSPVCKRLGSPGIDSARLGIDSWAPFTNTSSLPGDQAATFSSAIPVPGGQMAHIPLAIPVPGGQVANIPLAIPVPGGRAASFYTSVTAAVTGPQSVVCSHCYSLTDQQSLVSSHRSSVMVCSHWSAVTVPHSLISSHRSAVTDPQLEVCSHWSATTGVQSQFLSHRSAVNGQQSPVISHWSSVTSHHPTGQPAKRSLIATK